MCRICKKEVDSRCKKLYINCKDIVVIPSQFQDLEELECYNCISLKNITMFTELKKITVYGCSSLEEISFLPSLTNLIAMNCYNLFTISNMRNLKVLRCSNCVKLEEIPPYNTYAYEFTGCPFLTKNTHNLFWIKNKDDNRTSVSRKDIII